MTLTLRAGNIERLATHVCGQLSMLYPLSDPAADRALVMAALPSTLARVEVVVGAVHAFRAGHFDHLNTLQYASFLYLLGNEVWRAAPGDDMVDRLFGLNRMVSGLELFPAVDLPVPFFLSHALGAVLGNVEYGREIVVFQSVTVGRVGDRRPVIGDRVVLFAGASVTGSAQVGAGSVIAAGVQVHNLDVPPNSLVTQGHEGVEIRPLARDYHGLYYRAPTS